MYIGNLNFKKALVISALWHFLIGAIVVIIINPAGFSTSKFSTISFLGPILQETQVQKTKTPQATAESSITGIDLDRLNKFFGMSKIKIETPQRMVADMITSPTKESGYKIPFKQILSDYKEQPLGVYPAQSALRYRLSEISIEGEIENREIIYRPPQPHNFIIESTKSFYIDMPDELTLQIGLLVSSDGKIEAVDILKSTANTELDVIATAYVKKWLFVPQQASFKENAQQGTLTIVFNRVK